MVTTSTATQEQQPKAPSKWKSFLLRVVRTTGSLAVAGAAAKYQNNPLYLMLQPFLAGGAKLLRDKYPDNPLVGMIPL